MRKVTTSMPEQMASPSLQEALSQIGEIRAQMTEATLFRGYRALTVAATGGLAVLAAMLQGVLIADPAVNIGQYVALWVGLAALCFALVMIELTHRYLTTASELVRRDILHAAEKFAPCLLAGALVTVALLRFVPDSSALLPGLWSMFFSLGIFASWRKLPRMCLLIGGYYLAAGTALVVAAENAQSLSPYGMGLTFGVGQLATAAVLYFTLERNHGATE